ncbi:mucin desulfatase [Haloferula helveola]|uniref:Mucin desulfatase n=1 Tax=Haloferula helveola TaxID=490095 RepID=A0ABM7RI01_9BACT|nr:mucin desulfatase [Haloferula helveola]
MHDLSRIAPLFDMRADFVHAYPYGSGHINDTYCAWYDLAGHRIRYIHQRINHKVFKDPVALMRNIERVTRHALERLVEQGHPEARRRTLTTIPSVDGHAWAIDPEGNCWRTYPFIERARGYDEIQSEKQAEEAAKAFGEFQKLAADLPGERLLETIPNFHHTPKRLEALEQAIAKADPQRREAAKAEIEVAFAREDDTRRVTDLIESGEVPERVTHNDTKLNNVLLDDVTSEGVCVIDLDTTMPGSVLYDFGDMVRTACPTTREDEVDVSRIGLRLDRFEALLRGYLSSASSFLNQTEVDHLAFSGKLLTLECGIRFLTDFLEGDVYFKTKRPGHNLDRCRAQFAFLKAIEAKLPQMEDMVQTVSGKVANMV